MPGESSPELRQAALQEYFAAQHDAAAKMDQGPTMPATHAQLKAIGLGIMAGVVLLEEIRNKIPLEKIEKPVIYQDDVRPTINVRMRLHDAANFIGVHPTTLRRYANNGLVSVERTPGGHRVFSIDSLVTLEKSRRSRYKH